jgi:hypothetical protein
LWLVSKKRRRRRRRWQQLLTHPQVPWWTHLRIQRWK